MWPKAYQASNLPTCKSPEATYEGRTMVMMTWGQECDESLRLAAAHNNANFSFGVRDGKNVRLAIGRSLLHASVPQHWNRTVANKDKPYFFGSTCTLWNSISLLIAPPFLQIIKNTFCCHPWLASCEILPLWKENSGMLAMRVIILPFLLLGDQVQVSLCQDNM